MLENEHITPGEYLRNLSSRDFLSLGMEDMAYVRPVCVGDETAWAVHAADGTPLSVLDTREIALSIIINNALEPVTVQ